MFYALLFARAKIKILHVLGTRLPGKTRLNCFSEKDAVISELKTRMMEKLYGYFFFQNAYIPIENER